MTTSRACHTARAATLRKANQPSNLLPDAIIQRDGSLRAVRFDEVRNRAAIR
jgi:hypothetical protein